MSYFGRVLPRRRKTDHCETRKSFPKKTMSDRIVIPERLAKPCKLWQMVSDEDVASSKTLYHGTDVVPLGMYTFAVADSVAHRIVIVDIARNICSYIGEGRIWPNGITTNQAQDKLIITDRKDKMVKTFDLRGDLLSSWDPGIHLAEDTISWPHGVACNSKREIIVTNTATNSVTIHNPEGRLMKEFGGKGNLLQQFHLPFYCAVNGLDHILVSDNMNYCIKIFDRDGNYVNKIGSGAKYGHRQFHCPYGICTDPWSDDVLVADYENNRIFIFDAKGKFLGYAVSSGEQGVVSPVGIALGSCGVLLVTESNSDWTNIKAFRMYEARDGNYEIEDLWRHKTESLV